MTDLTNFRAVALAALARGFPAVTPLKGKHPFTHGWNSQWALRNHFDIEMAAREYPHHDVGLVMHKEVGLPFAWDIDKKGVLDRLPRELPDTYRVQTRPATAPHKQHIFFLHTEYSVSKFQKNINAGDYDLIGAGNRALQVVAEGCVRQDTQEVRKGNDRKIVRVPDWLVDWLLEDVSRLKAEQRKRDVSETIALAKTAVENTKVVPRGRRNFFLTMLAKWLVKFRMSRKDVLAEITRQCQLYCEDGVAYAQGTGKKTLKAIAYDKRFRPSDPLQWTPKEKTVTTVGTVLLPRLTARQARLLTISKFPDSISPADIYRRLGLVRDKKGMNILSRDMPEGGYVYDNAQHMWRRGTQ